MSEAVASNTICYALGSLCYLHLALLTVEMVLEGFMSSVMILFPLAPCVFSVYVVLEKNFPYSYVVLNNVCMHCMTGLFTFSIYLFLFLTMCFFPLFILVS